jgi:hypothetical protein
MPPVPKSLKPTLTFSLRRSATGTLGLLKGFGVWLTGPGAHRRDVLQLRPSERSLETESR